MTMEQIWKIEDRTDFLIALIDHISEKCQYGEAVSNLSEGERVVYVTQCLEMEVNNGGFSQYFYNSAGDFANELVQSYGKLGAVKTAEICKEALSFFDGKIPTDRDARYNLILDMGEDEAEAFFEQWDNAFYAYEEDLETLTYAYVLNHQDQFT